MKTLVSIISLIFSMPVFAATVTWTFTGTVVDGNNYAGAFPGVTVGSTFTETFSFDPNQGSHGQGPNQNYVINSPGSFTFTDGGFSLSLTNVNSDITLQAYSSNSFAFINPSMCSNNYCAGPQIWNYSQDILAHPLDLNQTASLPNLSASYPYMGYPSGTYQELSYSGGRSIIETSINTASLSGSAPSWKKIADDVGSYVNILSSALNVAALIVGSTSAATVLKIVANGGSIFASGAHIVALDPADPNFTVIATPQPATIDTSTFPSQLANLIYTEEQSIALFQAISTSFNRETGATDAGNTYWETQQYAALIAYEHQLSPLLSQLEIEISGLGSYLQSIGIDLSSITTSQIAAFEDSIAQNGLPTDIENDLLAFGADSNTINSITTQLSTQDINAVYQVTQNGLNDPSLNSSLLQLSQDFSAVPEPPVLVLMSLGLVGMSLVRRRRLA